jgi:hypothetical protein
MLGGHPTAGDGDTEPPSAAQSARRHKPLIWKLAFVAMVGGLVLPWALFALALLTAFAVDSLTGSQTAASLLRPLIG